MLGLGKLHSDSEIVAMQASSMSEFRMVRPVVSLAIPLALVIATMSVFVRPWAYAQTYETLAIAEASADIDRIKAGQFYLTRETALSRQTALSREENGHGGDQQRAIFIEKISQDQALERVFIRTRIGNELQIVSAQTGVFIERPRAAYFNLIGISRTWVEQQTTTSIWWTPLLLALVVVVCYLPWGSLRPAPARRQNDQD